MSMNEHIVTLTNSVIAAVVALVTGAVTWAIRRLLTNQQELAEARQKMERIEEKFDLKHEHLLGEMEELKEGQKKTLDVLMEMAKK